MTNTNPTTTTTYPAVSAMTTARTSRAIAATIAAPLFAGFADAVTTAYVPDWSANMVTFARRNTMRTIPMDHPAAIDVIGAVDAGTTVDASAAMRGTGKGYPRMDVIMPGHRTATDRFRTYTCGGIDGTCIDPDGPRHPANRFPTLTTPTSDGRNRNVAECRACRDHRTATNRAIRNGDRRDDVITAPTAVTVFGDARDDA